MKKLLGKYEIEEDVTDWSTEGFFIFHATKQSKKGKEPSGVAGALIQIGNRELRSLNPSGYPFNAVITKTKRPGSVPIDIFEGTTPHYVYLREDKTEKKDKDKNERAVKVQKGT